MLSRRMRRVKCPDGTVKYVYRNPTDAFPIALRSISSKLEGAVKSLESFEAQIAADTRREFQTLLIRLDETNQSMQADFNAIYMTFASDPCYESGYLHRKVDEIQKARHTLEETLIQVKILEQLIVSGADSAEVLEALKTAILSSRPSEIVETQRLVVQAPAAVEEWASE